jgi:CubicO group peptidase (beta-lactamase class C family)
MKRVNLLVACFALLSAATLPLRAQPVTSPLTPEAPLPAATTAPAEPPAPAAGTHALSRDDVQTWLDGYMPYALARGDVAGAVVVVVKDGQVLLQKGYGYSDVAARKPVDPASTLFRPGSVSKLFTWTAVMQQVEQGKINLDQDINSYLDFKIPPYQGKPVTMRNLMTHTAGFEEAVRNLIAAVPTPEIPLEHYLRSNIPIRIFPPGQMPAYSNYGAALAGYVVQRVSGEKFAAYIAQHIFKPLGMQHASFEQPLPLSLRPFISKGYNLGSGEPQAFEIVQPAPAGSSSISGDDMAKFMIAHLQDGAYDGQRILRAPTAREMHDTPFKIIPVLHSMLLGFYQMNRNGRRVIGHEGDSRWFHSLLFLLPDQDVGVFVSLNSQGSEDSVAAIRQVLFTGFTDRYFPPVASVAVTQVAPTIANRDGAMIAGHYISSRRDETNFFSLITLMNEATVSLDKDGHLTASDVTGVSGQPRKFEEVAPFVWRAVNGQELLAAKVVDNRIVMWGAGDMAAVEMDQPAPWYMNAAWLLPAVIISVVACLLTGLFWPVTAIVRRRYGGVFALRGNSRLLYRGVRLTGFCAGLLMAGWFAIEVYMLTAFAVSDGMDPLIWVLHGLSIVIFPLALVVAVWNAWDVWTTRAGWRPWFAKGWSLVLVLSSVCLVWTGVVFHLIGIGVSY